MSNSLLVLVYVLVVLSRLALTAHTNLGEWAKYKEQYGKVYTRPEEDAKRFALFSNAKKYEQLDKFNNPNGLDRYSDWTPKEIARLWQNDFEYSVRERRLHEIDPYVQALLDDPAPIPAEIDWRQVPNRVSPVARSRGCGCCWAFSAIGMLEGQQVARNFSKNLVPLSVQQLVDCSGLNDGCGGGYSILALVDIERLGGIQSAEDYPYTGVQATECQFDKSKSSVMTISGALYLPRYDLNALKKIVANYGPVAIALGTNKNFMEYTSGIFRDPTCEPKMSHAVLVVGYGNDTKEGDYWIIKNSWGEKWGEGGFMRIKSDQCGIGKISIIAKFNK